MSLRERMIRVLRRLFRLKPRRRWYEIDMRRFVQEENARRWKEPQS
ncbi:MAG: hypothetical protein IJU98_01280 [Synergistaceae bacterium]|nr:hypothetical protein [Synergistaceae bacterium]